MDALAQLALYETDALREIAAATDAAGIEAVRIQFLGKKQGRLKDLQSLLGQVDVAERPVLGKKFNEVKDRVTAALGERQSGLAQPAAVVDGLDVTLPGTPFRPGHRHPISQTIEEFKSIMVRLGFDAVDGPEIEDEFHNFEALNIPLDHPARDPRDNFYLVMQKTQPPVRIVSIGRVYRPDEMDDTHSCMFHQMEGLMVDTHVTMADLKTVLTLFAQAYLGKEVEIRFRPSFFPFTEPSVEVDMKWGDRWLEIGGAGMVDPNVLKAVGYDPEKVSGFAFGLGVERFCMRRHNNKDIRQFYASDVRFLSQF
jgi:phenylalanyl-tRNA synthetase alpha chain